MKRDEFLASANKLFDKTYEILSAKGMDYASEEDALRQFKETAAAVGVDPLQVWSVFFQKHLAAIMRFVRDGRVESEGVESRVIDLIAYLALFNGLIKERIDHAAQNHSLDPPHVPGRGNGGLQHGPIHGGRGNPVSGELRSAVTDAGPGDRHYGKYRG